MVMNKFLYLFGVEQTNPLDVDEVLNMDHITVLLSTFLGG